ncbi:MAG: hypothetical protein RIQ60_273 [Pseudomonadota bacterium]
MRQDEGCRDCVAAAGLPVFLVSLESFTAMTSLAHPATSAAATRTRQVGILLFDDIEVLDFAGPFEVFTTAGRVHGKLRRAAGADSLANGEAAPFAVTTIAARPGLVRARAGLAVLPDRSIDDDAGASPPAIDLLIVPGGVVDAAMQDAALVAWIARAAAGAELVASVCTGAFLLAQAGVLHGGSGSAGSGYVAPHQATTHWEDLDDLRARFPALQVRSDRRWVDAAAGGRIVSSAGISAGLDMSLHLVARLAGLDLARATARQMDYHWREDAAATDLSATAVLPPHLSPT